MKRKLSNEDYTKNKKHYSFSNPYPLETISKIQIDNSASPLRYLCYGLLTHISDIVNQHRKKKYYIAYSDDDEFLKNPIITKKQDIYDLVDKISIPYLEVLQDKLIDFAKKKKEWNMYDWKRGKKSKQGFKDWFIKVNIRKQNLEFVYNISKIGNSRIKIGDYISYTIKSPNYSYYGVVKEIIKKDYILCELRETNGNEIKWLVPKCDVYITYIYDTELKQMIQNVTHSKPNTRIFHISRCKVYYKDKNQN